MFLRDKAMPVVTAMLAQEFGISRDTAAKKCRDARVIDGYPIYPTAAGQYYMKRIKNGDDMTLILGVQDWSARETSEMRKINAAAKGQIEKTEKK
jgi:hypothetical protein